MAFFRDDPTRLSNVQWYYADPSLSGLPYATVFASQVWDMRDKSIPQPVIGERYQPRPYSVGNPPYPTGGGGDCGTKDQWLRGCLSSDAVPPIFPLTSVPICCLRPPDPFAGGQAIGGVGALVQEYSGGPPITVPCCPNPIPATLFITWGGALEAFGTIELYNYGGSTWYPPPDDEYLPSPCGPLGPWSIEITCQPGSHTQEPYWSLLCICSISGKCEFDFATSFWSPLCDPFFVVLTSSGIPIPDVAPCNAYPGISTATITETPP